MQPLVLTGVEGSRVIRWTHNDRFIERVYGTPVKAVALKDGSGVLVVEPASNTAPNNATIVNADGSLRTAIRNPEASNGALCFGDAYYVLGELTLIICFASAQMACVVDENGAVLRTYETR